MTSLISEVEQEVEEKYCKDCKSLLGVRYNTDQSDRWRCVHPNNLKENRTEIDLVTGLTKYIRVFFYENIYDLRNLSGVTLNDLPICGPEGIWYEKYMPPVREPDGIGGQAATEIVFDDTAIEANRKAAEERLRKIKEKRAGSLANIKATDL